MNKFKYNISINQKAAVDLNLDVDLIDLCIYDYIKSFAHTESCTKIQTPEGTFFWISHKTIMEQMPLLGIKSKQGILNRIGKLVKANLLIKSNRCEEYGMSLYRFGSNYDRMEFYTEVDTHKQNLTDPLNETLGTPLNETLGNNNINKNNSNKDNKEKHTFRNSSVFKMSIEEIEEALNISGLGIDTQYYCDCILDWSDQQDTKVLRTDKGWIATFRTFMRKDKEQNRLKRIVCGKRSIVNQDVKDMLEALNF